MQTFKSLLVLCGIALMVALNSPPAWGQQAEPPCKTECCGPFWTVFWVVTILLFLFLVVTFLGLLRSKDWSLADAVSEEAGNQPAMLPAGQKPIMVASSSRLVALLGLLGILTMFIGTGYHLLWSLFCGKTLPPLWEVMRFFYGGAAMFAPYLINQLKEAFSAFAPKQ